MGVAVSAMTPSTTATDIADYGTTGLPSGLGIDTGTGVISGTPDTADANTASAAVTVTDTAGNTVDVLDHFPGGGQGEPDADGVRLQLRLGHLRRDRSDGDGAGRGPDHPVLRGHAGHGVCTVDASTGALTLVGVGACNITATAAGTANYNEATAAFTVTVQAVGALALNLDTIAGDDTVNIAEKAAGFTIPRRHGHRERGECR